MKKLLLALITRDNKLNKATVRLRQELLSTLIKLLRSQLLQALKLQESKLKLKLRNLDVLRLERPIEVHTTRQKKRNSLQLEKRIVSSMLRMKRLTKKLLMKLEKLPKNYWQSTNKFRTNSSSSQTFEESEFKIS